MWSQLGETPVYRAAWNDHPESIQLLIVGKTDLNIANNVCMCTCMCVYVYVLCTLVNLVSRPLACHTLTD